MLILRPDECEGFAIPDWITDRSVVCRNYGIGVSSRFRFDSKILPDLICLSKQCGLIGKLQIRSILEHQCWRVSSFREMEGGLVDQFDFLTRGQRGEAIRTLVDTARNRRGAFLVRGDSGRLRNGEC